LTLFSNPNSISFIGGETFCCCSILEDASVPQSLQFPENAFPESAAKQYQIAASIFVAAFVKEVNI